MKKTPWIVGLELGPKQFVLAAGQAQDSGRLSVQAIESVPAQGFEREGLSDPIECADALARLVRQAEQTISGKLTRATVVFPANHLKSFNASATVPSIDPAVGISRQDVERAVTTCRSLSLEYDRQILHSFERGYSVDGQSGVRNPIGLAGKKLSVDLHLVTALNSTVQNFSRVLNRAGLEPEGFVLGALGTAEAVLTDLDRDLGVTLIRIGDSYTEIVLFDNSQIRDTYLIPGGWEDLLDGISRLFKIPRVSAEFLLDQVRSLEEPAPIGNDSLAQEVSGQWALKPLKTGQGAGARSFPQEEVVQIVRARAKELLTRIQRRLVANPLFLDSSSGIVVVGSMARLDGFLEMAESLMNMPVRLGTLKEAELNPGLSVRMQDLTPIGLLRYSMRKKAILPSVAHISPWMRPIERVQKLLQEYF